MANVSRNTITLTITMTRQTLDYPDTGESGQTYDLEGQSSNTKVL